MSRKYVFVRMPVEIYDLYKGIKNDMQNDIKKVTGKDIKLTMPKVFKAVASPQFNENFITVDLRKLAELGKQRRNRNV